MATVTLLNYTNDLLKCQDASQQGTYIHTSGFDFPDPQQELKDPRSHQHTTRVPEDAQRAAKLADIKPHLDLKPQRKPEDLPPFDPDKHLGSNELPKTYTMEELGFGHETGISPVAVSEPFPLFSPEAIELMRSEILSDEVFENCQFSSNISSCQLRGFASKYAPFVYDAFKNRTTLEMLSKVAGIELVPVMDYEIGHINISVKTEEQKDQELQEYNRRLSVGSSDEDKKPIVGWHTDSYPFVCVVMLSDSSSMIGGETELCTGNGDIMKVRGPQRGHAVVMQGGYICHQAVQSIGVSERITLVTSLRAKRPDLPDDSALTTVRGISNLGELYEQFAEYRFEIAEERIRLILKELRSNARAGKKFETNSYKTKIHDLVGFLNSTDQELVEDHLVTKGHVPESIPDSETLASGASGQDGKNDQA